MCQPILGRNVHHHDDHYNILIPTVRLSYKQVSGKWQKPQWFLLRLATPLGHLFRVHSARAQANGNLSKSSHIAKYWKLV